MTEDPEMAAKKRGKKRATISDGANPPSELACAVDIPELSGASPPVAVNEPVSVDEPVLADEDTIERERGRPELCVAGLVASAGGRGAVAVLVDISERKQTVESLRVSEERFRMLFERSRDAIVVTDDDGRYLLVKQAACELFGYPLDQFLHMRVADLATRGAHNAAAQFEAYRANGSATGEFHFLNAKGEERVADYAAVQLTTGQHLSILRDVTERRRMEDILRDREARLAAILNTAADGVITIDSRGVIQSANPAAERMFGYAAAEMIGQNVKMLMPALLSSSDASVRACTTVCARN